MTPISDYGKLYAAWDPYIVHAPRDQSEVCEIVGEARRRQTPIRVRGSAHTFSGAAIPRRGEILLRTSSLDRYLFDSAGTINVGSGAIAWDVRDLVEQYGLQMPVYNGGWAGPTIGGYLAAGGMGLRVPPGDRERWLATPIDQRPPLMSISQAHGGFWEHVADVTMVDGTGTVHRISETDPEFPWLFGSFGQFGVVTRVRLKVIGSGAAPIGREGRVPRVQVDDPAINDTLPGNLGNRILFWFSYLVSPDQEDGAWQHLREWVERHSPFLAPQGGWVGPRVRGQEIGYRYHVTYRRFHPPLLYPRAGDFVLMGLMATFDGVGTAAVDDRILALERDFVSIALGNGYRLYPQAENIGRGIDYAAYYGPAIFATFQQLKQRFDPDGIINPGVVFPSEVPPPPRTSVARQAESLFTRLFGDDS